MNLFLFFKCARHMDTYPWRKRVFPILHTDLYQLFLDQHNLNSLHICRSINRGLVSALIFTSKSKQSTQTLLPQCLNKAKQNVMFLDPDHSELPRHTTLAQTSTTIVIFVKTVTPLWLALIFRTESTNTKLKSAVTFCNKMSKKIAQTHKHTPLKC